MTCIGATISSIGKWISILIFWKGPKDSLQRHHPQPYANTLLLGNKYYNGVGTGFVFLLSLA